MKQLENRTLDSKIELEIMDALDEIKAVNRRHETVDTEDVLKASAARRDKGSGLVSSQDMWNDTSNVLAALPHGTRSGPKHPRRCPAPDALVENQPHHLLLVK